MQYSFGPPFFSGPRPANHSAPPQHDGRYVAQRLDVVDRRRTLVQPGDRRKGRLQPRLRALALERLDERRLLARLVCAGATVHEDVAVEPAAEDVLAEISGRIGLLDLGLENPLHVIELAANVDVGDLRADRVAGNRAPFDEQVRIALHQHVVLERPGLALVGVATEILRQWRVLEHELPLHAGRKPGAAAATKARGLDPLDHVVGRDGERRTETVVAPLLLQIGLERVGVRVADVRRQDRFVDGSRALSHEPCAFSLSR